MLHVFSHTFYLFVDVQYVVNKAIREVSKTSSITSDFMAEIRQSYQMSLFLQHLCQNNKAKADVYFCVDLMHCKGSEEGSQFGKDFADLSNIVCEFM